MRCSSTRYSRRRATFTVSAAHRTEGNAVGPDTAALVHQGPEAGSTYNPFRNRRFESLFLTMLNGSTLSVSNWAAGAGLPMKYPMELVDSVLLHQPLMFDGLDAFNEYPHAAIAQRG